MRLTSSLAATAALIVVGGALTTPAAATAPVKKTAGGTVMVDIANGCSVRLVGPGKGKKSRSVSGVVRGLKPGVYRLTVRPTTCIAKPAKLRVKKGKKVRARVLNDPKLVPTSLTGTFSGSENGPTQTVGWNGQLTLTLDTVGTSGFPGFAQLAQYRVTAVSGTWSIGGGVDGGCTYSGGGQLALDDFRADTGNHWVNPWENFTYAFETVSNNTKQWSLTATCPKGDGFEARQETRAIPFRLLASNQWSGIQTVPPLQSGANPAGTLTWQQGSTTTTWEWSLNADGTKEYSKP